jgi:hypothetical protein
MHNLYTQMDTQTHTDIHTHMCIHTRSQPPRPPPPHTHTPTHGFITQDTAVPLAPQLTLHGFPGEILTLWGLLFQGP